MTKKFDNRIQLILEELNDLEMDKNYDSQMFRNKPEIDQNSSFNDHGAADAEEITDSKKEVFKKYMIQFIENKFLDKDLSFDIEISKGDLFEGSRETRTDRAEKPTYYPKIEKITVTPEEIPFTEIKEHFEENCEELFTEEQLKSLINEFENEEIVDIEFSVSGDWNSNGEIEITKSADFTLSCNESKDSNVTISVSFSGDVEDEIIELANEEFLEDNKF